MTNKSRMVIDMTLPPNTPLFATTKEASRLFGLGRTRLYELRRDHPEFKAMTVKTGREVLFDVPRCYEWLQYYCGGELE